MKADCYCLDIPGYTCEPCKAAIATEEIAALRARVAELEADRDLWRQRAMALGWPTPEQAAAARYKDRIDRMIGPI